MSKRKWLHNEWSEARAFSNDTSIVQGTQEARHTRRRLSSLLFFSLFVSWCQKDRRFRGMEKSEPREPSTIVFSIFFFILILWCPRRSVAGRTTGWNIKRLPDKRDEARGLENWEKEWLGSSFLRLSLPLGNRGVQEKVVPRKRRRFDPSPISHSFFFHLLLFFSKFL